MDEETAKGILDKIDGRRVGDWAVGQLLGLGRSAFVCEGQKNGERAAIKIFDPELVRRHGVESQLERINRQTALVGKTHRNVVQVLGGGQCPDTGHLYVTMELLDAPTLDIAIPELPRDRIRMILGDLVSGIRFLDELGLVHRDIKPSNIALTEDRGAVLLDLGVVRPYSLGDLTDASGQGPFLGTLRYSAPEYLVRDESGTQVGWTALTVYQLGAVLHDMITRQPLFQDFTEPYARLVLAVMNERPQTFAPDVPSDLILLAQNSLTKDPVRRLKVVGWDSFEKASRPQDDPVQAARSRIALQQEASRGGASAQRTLETEHRATAVLLIRLVEAMAAAVRTVGLSDLVFPRKMVIVEDSGDRPSATITVNIPRSADHALLHEITVWFQLDLDDPEAHMGRISSSAAMGADALPVAVKVVYEGALSELVFADIARGVLYLVLDRAIAACAMESLETPLEIACAKETSDA